MLQFLVINLLTMSTFVMDSRKLFSDLVLTQNWDRSSEKFQNTLDKLTRTIYKVKYGKLIL